MNKITVEQVEACISNGTTIITNSRLLLRNLFQLEYQNVNRNAYVTGIGDFLRGAYSVWQICKVLNVKYELYLHNHPMGKYFIAQDKNREIAKLSVPAFLTVTYPDVRRTFISFVISHLSSESINIGANFFPIESVGAQCCLHGVGQSAIQRANAFTSAALQSESSLSNNRLRAFVIACTLPATNSR